MYIVKISRLYQSFEKDGHEYFPSEWEFQTTITPYPTRNDAISALKTLKAKYHGTGKVESGVIKGKKVTKADFAFANIKTVESIRTELLEINYNVELIITEDSDVGEYQGCL